VVATLEFVWGKDKETGKFHEFLVHVGGSDAGRCRLQFAVALAARLEARLTGLHFTPSAQVPPLYKPSRIAAVAAEISARLAIDAHSAARIFREETAQRLPDAAWIEAAGDMVTGINDAARYADLVILGQYESQGSPETNPLPVAHSVVSHCGRPVLVLPAMVELGSLARIALAWDGGREAVRAVHDALPLLRLVQSVQIVTVTEPSAEDGTVGARRLSAHLATHGISVATEALELRNADENGSLHWQIEQGHYDLVVMGGYPHPMWLEFIFGGATHSILLSSKIPIFVSH
jgi:nucleotide-binding universal stress UspA family protein